MPTSSSLAARAVRAVRGPRLSFVRFSERSITPDYLGWLNDPALLTFTRQRFSAHTETTARAYLATFEQTDNHFWSIHRSDDETMIGTVTMYCDANTGVGDFGILIGHAQARGRGFGNEACGIALAFMFDVAGLRRVTAGASAPNVAMNRCCRHWGMTLEGVLRLQETMGLDPVVPVNGHFYGILREEWEALPGRLSVTTSV